MITPAHQTDLKNNQNTFRFRRFYMLKLLMIPTQEIQQKIDTDSSITYEIK